MASVGHNELKSSFKFDRILVNIQEITDDKQFELIIYFISAFKKIMNHFLQNTLTLKPLVLDTTQ